MDQKQIKLFLRIRTIGQIPLTGGAKKKKKKEAKIKYTDERNLGTWVRFHHLKK
jgi:hypothetical protein